MNIMPGMVQRRRIPRFTARRALVWGAGSKAVGRCTSNRRSLRTSLAVILGSSILGWAALYGLEYVAMTVLGTS